MSNYIKKTFEYIAGNTFNKLLLLLLLPLFTRFLVPEEYAVYTNITIFIAFVSLIYMMGLQQALFSYFYEHKDKGYQFTVISSILVTMLIFGVIFSFLIMRYRFTLAELITTTTEYADILIYVSIILISDALYGIILRVINTLERSLNYALLSVVKNLSLLILISVGALVGKFSIQAVFLYMTISSLLALLIALFNVIDILIELRQYSKTRPTLFSVPIMLDLLKFGLPMIPGTISFMILRVSDRYMLTYLSEKGLYDVGIYAIGYKIGMILVFLNSIVSLVYFPYAMKIAKHPKANSSYRRMFEAYSFWGGLLGFLIVIFAWEISLLLIDSSYFEAVKVVVFGVISSYLHGLFNLVNISFYIRKRAGNIAVAVIMGAILNIILNFLLIPQIGIYGAGIASIISYVFIFLLNYHISENLFPLNFSLRHFMFFLTAMVIASGLNFFFRLIPLLTIAKIVILLGIIVWYYMVHLHKDLKKMSFSAFLAEKFRI